MFVNCIHVFFCRVLGLVTGFNAICNACLAGVPSGSLKNVSSKSKFVFIYFIST